MQGSHDCEQFRGALAGQAVLGGPEHASRMVMFRMFYLGLSPHDTARHFLGIGEMSWVKWSEDAAAASDRNCCAAKCFRRANISGTRISPSSLTTGLLS
jgi:hypothetical protein